MCYTTYEGEQVKDQVCNICNTSTALYDGKTNVNGRWAFMCGGCVITHGYPDIPDLCKRLKQIVPVDRQEFQYHYWKNELEAILIERCGCGIDDLPDYSIRDAYDSGEEPEEVADQMLEEAGFF